MKRIFSIIRSNTTQKRVLSKSEYTNTKPKLKLKKKWIWNKLYKYCIYNKLYQKLILTSKLKLKW
jgi:hypothetical protein